MSTEEAYVIVDAEGIVAVVLGREAYDKWAELYRSRCDGPAKVYQAYARPGYDSKNCLGGVGYFNTLERGRCDAEPARL